MRRLPRKPPPDAGDELFPPGVGVEVVAEDYFDIADAPECSATSRYSVPSEVSLDEAVQAQVRYRLELKALDAEVCSEAYSQQPTPLGAHQDPARRRDVRATATATATPMSPVPVSRVHVSHAGDRSQQYDVHDHDSDLDRVDAPTHPSFGTADEDFSEAAHSPAFQVPPALDSLFPKSYFEVNENNLIVPVDVGLWDLLCDLRKNGRELSARVLFALLFHVCSSGALEGELDARELARLMWGSRRPRHWRGQLQKSASFAVGHVREHRGSDTSMSLVGNKIRYKVDRKFLGALGAMVTGGKIKLLRTVDHFQKLTPERLLNLRIKGGYPEHERPDKEMREIVASERHRCSSLVTIAKLAVNKKITVAFAPAYLGEPVACRRIGPIVQLLSQNVTRRCKVENAKIFAFSGNAKRQCPLLDPTKSYVVFGANGVRRGRGYLPSRWVKMLNNPGVRDFRALLDLWTKATELQLIIVGIDRDNRFYNAEELKALPLVALEKVHVRVYTPTGWQKSWSSLLGMTSEAEVAGKAPNTVFGDLPELRSLVMVRGLRASAQQINVDPGNLSRFLKTGAGLNPMQSAQLRLHVQGNYPSGGHDIADQFYHLITEYPGSLGWALAYLLVLHWPVIPLVPGSRKGHVRWKRYQKVLPTKEEVISWWRRWPNASIGLILGHLSGVFAIDVDNAEAEEALIRLLGQLPECTRQLSGGYSDESPYKRHFLFRHPAYATRGQAKPLVPGLEFRGRNGLLILAPSTHKSGKSTYNWEDGFAIWQRPLAPIPCEVEELLHKPVVKRGSSGEHPPVPQSENVRPSLKVQMAGFGGRSFSTNTLEFLRGSIFEGERNKRLFAAAQEIRDYGVPLEIAHKTLLPPGEYAGLTQEESLATIRSVYSRETRPRGK